LSMAADTNLARGYLQDALCLSDDLARDAACRRGIY
jgi:hypothetical protein